MTSAESPHRQIALLIDGDNAQPSLLDQILAETAKYGVVTTRRIYGDWTEPNMKGWKAVLQDHAIQPIQQFRNTVRKNATDSALIIDAMDILHAGAVNGFCIVSSDSDFTRLATRIRESGVFVMGIGRADTPRSFVHACEVFVRTDNLDGAAHPEDPVPGKIDLKQDDQPPVTLKKAFEMAIQDDGWAILGAIGTHVRQLDPSFDPRTYGHKQLSQLVKAFPSVFELVDRGKRNGPSVLYVRLRQ